jgi:WD40 repeat protein
MADYRVPIILSALQVYYSGLVTMPDCGLRSQEPHLEIGKLVTDRDRQWRTGGLVLEGHTDCVNSVAYSPDGSQIISGSDDMTVRVWDVVSAVHVRTLTGHTKGVKSVAFAPDGSQIISGSLDHTARVWDAISGANKQILVGHTKWVMSVAFAPDGSQIISTSNDKTMRVWDNVSGAHMRTYPSYWGGVTCVAFSPDGSYMIVGSWYAFTVRVINTVSGKLKYTLTGHTLCVTCVAYSPDGLQIISGSSDNTVRVWEAASGLLQQTLRGHTGQVFSVAYSPNGLQFISGSSDKTVQVWDATLGVPTHTLNGSKYVARSAVMSVARALPVIRPIIGVYDKIKRTGYMASFALQFMSIGVGMMLDKIANPDEAIPEGGISLAFTLDGSQIISYSDRFERVWDAGTGKLRHTRKRRYPPSSDPSRCFASLPNIHC